MAIVSNSGPIISFLKAGHFRLLPSIARELFVPEAVYGEIVVVGSGRADAPTILEALWIRKRSVEDRTVVETLPHKLHLGEREAIVLAKQLGAALLIDEREARKEALRLGIDFFGSLRILKEAKDRGFVSHIQPTLDDFIRTGTYISDSLYQEFLRQIGEP